jgi:hypothetical protein
MPNEYKGINGGWPTYPSVDWNGFFPKINQNYYGLSSDVPIPLNEVTVKGNAPKWYRDMSNEERAFRDYVNYRNSNPEAWKEDAPTINTYTPLTYEESRSQQARQAAREKHRQLASYYARQSPTLSNLLSAFDNWTQGAGIAPMDEYKPIGEPVMLLGGPQNIAQLSRTARMVREFENAANEMDKAKEASVVAGKLFPVRNSQVRTYNATSQEPPAISWENAVEPNTTKAAVESAVESNPFKYKDNNNIDTFRQILFNNQINTFLNGKSTDFLGHKLPDTWKSTHFPFPESVQAEINNSMMPRIINQRQKYWGDEYDKLYEKYKDDPTVWLPEKDVFIESKMREDLRHYNATISQGYDLGSESFFQDYQKAEGIKDKKVLGLQLDSSGRIIARDGVKPEKVLGHEWGHRRTNINSGGSELTPSEDKILSDAYGDDFVGLSNTVEDFKSMNLKNERNTLNSDARRELIGEYHSQKTNVELQNKIIDKKTDEQVFAAVEHADGYGKEYIKYLREHGKLTHEKANFFRTAMKEVGMYGLPAILGGGLLYGIGQENNNKIQ